MGGTVDNVSADHVLVAYRQTGTGAIITEYNAPTGPGTLAFQLKGLSSGQNYDVLIAYLIRGLQSDWLVIPAVTAGAFAGGTTGAPGTVYANTSTAGAGNTTFPAPPSGNVVIRVGGPGGDGNFTTTGSGKGGFTITAIGGGGGGVREDALTGLTGNVTVNWNLGTPGQTSNVTTPVTMTADPGGNATTTTHGLGGNSTGNGTGHLGHDGALVDSWDAGGVYPLYVDNTTQNTPGPTPGVGGSGAIEDPTTGNLTAAPGANGWITITAAA